MDGNLKKKKTKNIYYEHLTIDNLYKMWDIVKKTCKNKKEVKQYFEEEGVDLCGMSTEELLEQPEVFALSGGRYLIVEG